MLCRTWILVTSLILSLVVDCPFKEHSRPLSMKNSKDFCPLSSWETLVCSFLFLYYLWFCYQDNDISFIKWNGKCFFFLYFLEETIDGIWQNPSMKIFGPRELFFRFFFNSKFNALILIVLFKWSVSYWVSCSLCFSRK